MIMFLGNFRAKSHMKEGLKADINIENETKSSNEVHKSEFLIVQTMNKIKQLLWVISSTLAQSLVLSKTRRHHPSRKMFFYSMLFG